MRPRDDLSPSLNRIAGRKARVFVVEGCGVMRRLIAQNLLSDGRFDVVGTAGDPFEARDAIKSCDPDLITLAFDMPRMDGLSFLQKIMQLRPTPVVMLASKAEAESDLAVRALAMGAVDCLRTSLNSNGDNSGDFADRLFIASHASVTGASPHSAVPSAKGFQWNSKITLIGASTGGVEALERVLCHMPRNCPPVVVVQHMPAPFLMSFAQRLSDLIAPRVELATTGTRLEPGLVCIAPGGNAHLTIEPGQEKILIRLKPGAPISGHCPSIDGLFQSAVPIAKRVVAVLLTGMGRDGATGLCELRTGGARTVAQDEASSVVYGMPRMAVELGAAEYVANIDEIGPKALALCSRGLN